MSFHWIDSFVLVCQIELIFRLCLFAKLICCGRGKGIVEDDSSARREVWDWMSPGLNESRTEWVPRKYRHLLLTMLLLTMGISRLCRTNRSWQSSKECFMSSLPQAMPFPIWYDRLRRCCCRLFCMEFLVWFLCRWFRTNTISKARLIFCSKIHSNDQSSLVLVVLLTVLTHLS